MKKNSRISKIWEFFKQLVRCFRTSLKGQQPPELIFHNFEYQKEFIQRTFTEGDKILDVGSGGDPFPYATHLADRFLEPTNHRVCEFAFNGKPIIISDVQFLPFKDKCFDYVFCSHVLEHVENPIKACREIQRIGKSGYIETPNFIKDVLFSWAKGMHKWYVSGIGNTLVFFEYSERQLRGIGGNIWRDHVFAETFDPWQRVYRTNQDLFNTMFQWNRGFNVVVFRLNGKMETSFCPDGAQETRTSSPISR